MILATLDEFVKRMLDDAAIGGQEVMFSILEDGEYAAEIKNFGDFFKISEAIFNRECYPYTPSYFMRGFRQYNAKVSWTPDKFYATAHEVVKKI